VKHPFIYMLFLSLLASTLLGQTIQRFADPLVHEESFTVTKRDTDYTLEHPFIIQDSLRITIDSLAILNTQYQVDWIKGIVRFISLPDSGVSIHVWYKAWPFQLRPVYQRWALSTPDTTEESVHPARIRQTIQSGTSVAYGDESLQRSGSIFRGISLGTNQGMRLQSGLRLQVAGKVAPDVEVVASLTDQNTPIQPEGNTQSLQEIDKVFVNIFAPHFQATMGDFMYESGGSYFGTYSRKLQGGMATAESNMGSVTLMGAASKGEFTTNHFIGQEGTQGPYQLTGNEGQQDIIVLAGTERIWIDGETMTRGEDHDYVIEYGLGQITFTRNRLITGDSRITVDFEYSDQKFQKSVYGAQGNARFWNDRIEFRTSFLQESDNKDNPIEFPITDAYLSALESAGDNPDSAVVSGGNYLGEGKGNYIQIDTLDQVIYKYVGEGNGDYGVRFSHVGYGKGDYSFQGYGIYRYEGAHLGTYLPVILLPLARKHQMANAVTEIHLSKNISLSGEAAISNQDLNQFSALDDGDNTDQAYRSVFNMKDTALRGFGKSFGQMDLNLQLRHVGDQYRPVGRMSDVEHGRKWGTEEGRVWGEDSREAPATYRPFANWQITGEMGNFSRTEGFQSDRKLISTRLDQKGLPRFNFQNEWIDTKNGSTGDGEWKRQNGRIEAGLWRLRPTIAYEGEHRKQVLGDTLTTGFRFEEWRGGMGVDLGPIQLLAEETMRDDRQYESNLLKPNSKARTDRISMKLNLGPNYSTSIMFTHRTRDYVDPGFKDQIADLADMKMRFSLGPRLVDGTLNYQFSSTQVSEMVRDTIQVGPGLGNYRFDETLNELIPDPDGDLLIRMIQTGEFIPVNDLKTGLELRWDGSGLFKSRKHLKSIFSNLKGRTRFRTERRDRAENFRAVNKSAFQPDWGSDSTVVTGVFSIYQDIEYSPTGGWMSLRLLYQNNDSENHQLAQEGQVHLTDEKSVRLKLNPVRSLGMLAEYGLRTDDKDYENALRSDRDIEIQTFTGEVSYRPRQQIEFALKTQIRQSEDKFPDYHTKAFSFFLLPRFSYAFRMKGHLRAEMEFGNVTTDPIDVSLPYEMLSGDQPGRTIRWNMLFTYRVTGHVQCTVTYRGRQEPWRKQLFQTGQVEVRAFF